jgi:broad specificity phosphatase PhoE
MDNNINVNFIFVRHGYALHNAFSSLRNKGLIKTKFKTQDPHLTQLGVDASIYNGCVLGNVLKRDLSFNSIDIVGCSPLVRSMETAYFMTSKWNSPPKKIEVFPYLRELDESTVSEKNVEFHKDPYYQLYPQFKSKNSLKSKNIINSEPAYAMKSISQQKSYIESIGLINTFDFSYVEQFNKERVMPGDIPSFISWFFNNYLKVNKSNSIKNKPLNVLIVTHAGVLRDYFGEGVYNNAGVLLNVSYTKNIILENDVNVIESLNNILLEKGLFVDYSNSKYDLSYYCPSKRSGELCPSDYNNKNNKLNSPFNISSSEHACNKFKNDMI